MALDRQAVHELQLIVPNLHRRYSGVTATNRMVAPKLAKVFRAAWLGSDAPEGMARMDAADLLKLWRRREPLIWHARRNDEMIAGVLLRALGWPLKRPSPNRCCTPSRKRAPPTPPTRTVTFTLTESRRWGRELARRGGV